MYTSPFMIGQAVGGAGTAAAAAAPAAAGTSLGSALFGGPLGIALSLGQLAFGMVSRQNAINEAKNQAFKANQVNVGMKKEEYQRVIAEARARIGASGVTMAGSPAAVLAESAREAERNLFNMRGSAPPLWKLGQNRDEWFKWAGEQVKSGSVVNRQRLPGVDWGF